MPHDREFDKPGIYHIKIKGVLDRKWSDWFDGFDILHEVKDETLLVGTVRDQAALYGLLSKIRDLGLPLLMVQWIEGAKPEVRGASSCFSSVTDVSKP